MGTTLSYLIPDALSSTGSVTATRLFAPYGGVRYSQGTMPTTYTFTGQRLDSETGLLYYNARYYDAVSGRFVRADTVQNNAGGNDPYAYVGNNPEGRTDPTGKCWPWCTALIGAIVGAVVNVAVTTVTAAAQGRAPTGGELLQAAVVGGVTGAITGVLGPEAGPAARVAVGALANGAGQMAGNLVSGKPVMDGVAQAVIAGAITGGLVEGAGTLLKGVGEDAATVVSEERSSLKLEGTTCSFTSTTVVATTHGEQAIGKLQVGDKVEAYNPKTHKMELQPILHVWVHTDNDLVDLTLTTTASAQDGKPATRTSETIHTNQKHPFFTLEQGFLPVGKITLGMHVLRADGTYGVVTGWRIVPGAKVMYNLEVAQDHTFTVGDGQWVVHNCGGGTPSGNNPFAQSGNNFHYDQLNGGPANSLGGPSQLQAMYPQTEFEFTLRGVAGPDVEVTGGIHPSDTSVYPNSTWPQGSNYGDFKPNTLRGQRQFRYEIGSSKLPAGTVPIWYDPVSFLIVRLG